MSNVHLQCGRLNRAYLIQMLILVLSLLALTGTALAGSVNLAWDGVSTATGYSLAYGTASGTYTSTVDAGNNTTATVSELTAGTRYYFAVQAYNATATSGYSNEVSAVVPTSTTVPVTSSTAPTASFTANGSGASSITVTPGQTVTLVDTSSGTVTSRVWNLGDGTSATTATVVKTYPTTGTRTVRLSVTGAGVTSTATKTINVTAVAPVANFSASPTSGTAPLAVRFSDASTGSITSWSWSFGTGATSTAQNPSYTYSSPGTYTVSLTVSGPGGSNTANKTGYITVAPASTSASTSTGTSGLVAAYGFDETTGTQALDGSGNGNHGAVSNAGRSSFSKFGGALYFNGYNSLVTASDSNSLDLSGAMTLSAWVYPTSWTTGWKSLIMKERSGGLAYALSANSDLGQPATTLRIGSRDRQLHAGSHLPSSTWTHLAATYDGATQRLYVNGVQVGSRAQAGGIETSAHPLRIGGNTVWANQYFQGMIDEVRIYNRALSQAEIAAVAQQPVTQAAANTSSLCSTGCSLWDSALTPAVAAAAESSPVELGVKIRSDVDGTITGVRFYKGTGSTGTHVGRLWSNTGQLLAQATFTNETASGWQQVNFAAPVAIKANTTYVVSYHAPVGRFAYNNAYFTSAYSKGPLRALSSTEAGGNGVYRYGSGGVFPTGSYYSRNYWVDVAFRTP
jgi:PKD repeat protein